ncbi:hypothetical protein [Gleimia europaea]|uniref:DUF4129 domain-containing protein n=1 Tax=Gleimia europaea ACS-120-V-Col10b TaxID=883069 RepID=A0A9W5RFC2_9ACTO|nr:hypothetical protein [Gleimia europaea]EPD31423.1 hypothetical protein HMPREF9238_01194 [Gleimia europaea ACS-120-V-Col10b]
MNTLVAHVALALEPTPDEARELLRRELSKNEYLEGQSVQGVLNWLLQRIGTTVFRTAEGTFNWMLLVIIAVVIIALIVGIYARVGREQKTVSATQALTSLSANEHRRRALDLKNTDPTEALKAGFRAIIVRLDATAAPGRTTGEITRLITREYPALKYDVARCASKFDVATYRLETIGTVTTQDVEAMLALDDEIQKRLSAQVSS